MAEYSEPEERTEDPTSRRWGEIRKEGAVFLSIEVVHVLTMLTGYYGIIWITPYLMEKFKITFRVVFGMIANPEPITPQFAYRGFLSMLYLFGPILFLFIGAIAATAFFSVMLQTDWNVKEKKLKFDFMSVLNPINGFKKIFSVQGFITTGKAILKLVLILPLAYFALKPEAYKMVGLLRTSLMEVFMFTRTEMDRLFWRILYVMIGIALFDYFYGKYRWFRINKMTKPEVKDEKKSIEGDETTRRKIIAKGLARIAQRLQFTVPKATVVITNPTHYAVALQYERGIMKAPRVVAKGTDYLAFRIREIAKEAGVPIVERKALARALYSSVEVGKEIPYDLFKAVAEVLAYVFKLKNPWAHKKQTTTQGQAST